MKASQLPAPKHNMAPPLALPLKVDGQWTAASGQCMDFSRVAFPLPRLPRTIKLGPGSDNAEWSKLCGEAGSPTPGRPGTSTPPLDSHDASNPKQ